MTQLFKYILRDANGHRIGGEYDNVVVAREIAFSKCLILERVVYRMDHEEEVADYTHRAS
jgi:hypothetical protein